MTVRHDWTVEEVEGLLQGPLAPLCAKAREIHTSFAAQDLQKCELLSIKTGGCSEDCGYCSQSAHYQTEVKATPLMDRETVQKTAQAAKARGASRFCLGAAWREVPDDHRFQLILQMIRDVRSCDLEVCVTLGMANESQLKQMKEAGLTAYNHNLDTSREYYGQIISTRTFQDRLNTLQAARAAGVQVCSGGILGMGESVRDRASMLVQLTRLDPHPESVPINLLVPIAGTPLQKAPPIPFEEFLRTIATARIMMPRSRIRLSAGRNRLSVDKQQQCFRVGANSIFFGEKLLTTPNVEPLIDEEMFAHL